jgi:hypothetical protein
MDDFFPGKSTPEGNADYACISPSLMHPTPMKTELLRILQIRLTPLSPIRYGEGIPRLGGGIEFREFPR